VGIAGGREMIGVFSSGVRPLVEFRIKDCQIEGMITCSSAEPMSSSLHAISLDETCPVDVKSSEDFCEIIRVWFAGLVVRVPPS
jgi:hypothetical protein